MEAEFKKLPNNSEKIKFLLENKPEFRNDIDSLVFTFLYYEIGSDTVSDMTGYEVFCHLTSKYRVNISKISSIIRAVSKVKQRHPELKSNKDVLDNKSKIKPIFIVRNKD
jgi:hypothetical protein